MNIWNVLQRNEDRHDTVVEIHADGFPIMDFCTAYRDHNYEILVDTLEEVCEKHNEEVQS